MLIDPSFLDCLYCLHVDDFYGWIFCIIFGWEYVEAITGGQKEPKLSGVITKHDDW